MVWIVDVTAEQPSGVGLDLDACPRPAGDFCSRGGRFGTHSSNENMTPIYYQRIMFFAHFNAGVRAVDIRDPYHPKEIGYYIPAVTEKTDKRCVDAGQRPGRCKMAIQTNNVEVDDRGYIYIVDRANTGMHILELTGAGAQDRQFSAVRVGVRPPEGLTRHRYASTLLTVSRGTPALASSSISLAAIMCGSARRSTTARERAGSTSV